MNSVILFRKSFETEDEFSVCKRHGNIFELRSKLPKNSLVVGRYSVLPYYKELELDLESINSKLINSYDQHKYIANFEYYEDIKDFTFETWDDSNFYLAPEGKYVVKGRTNSRKHQWNTLCFAENKKAALNIAGQLMSDPLICEQGVIYRKYEPLQTFEIGINNLPITNEWRFFILGKNIIAYNYYWSNADDETIRKAKLYTDHSTMIDFVRSVIKRIYNNTNFFVVDVGIKEDGSPIIIEINDGQMSGLSTIDPSVFYFRLNNELSLWRNKI